ncbi:MAG TPA: hypothetical protein VGQ84_00420 [Gaiellaceae bacterium]|jgi:hypothetical protein|nr:hypothetical protein [Gaiellaceae bacterium]
MSDVDWPSPEPSSREPAQRPLPLPRVEDLPIAEQGYDREKVQDAFDAFYRHAAQLDATLRTLEAVEVFQRTAAELRAELRTIRGSGLSVGSWQSDAGYGARQSVTEWSPSPAVKRVAGEFGFIILIGAIVGWAKWSPLTIVLVMSLALAIVLLVEWVASRERAIPRAAAPAQAPALDERAELEAAPAPAQPQQEGPEAMTIFGAAPVREAEPAEPQEEAAPPEPEPEEAVSNERQRDISGDGHRELAEEAEPILEEALQAVPETDTAAALEDTAEEGLVLDAPEEDAVLDEAAAEELPVEDVAPDEVAVAVVAVEAEAEPDVPVAEEEPKPDEEREVGEPQEPEESEEEREDDLVAAAEELEAAPEPELALGGAEPLETGPKRRRFRLFRRREAEAPSADGVAAEHVPGEPLEPAPGSPEPSVQPGPDLEPPELEPEEPEEPDEHVDPWEQAAEIPEREPIAQINPEPEPEPEPEVREPPVEALAEQAAAALDRSRARRRAPRRARRR